MEDRRRDSGGKAGGAPRDPGSTLALFAFSPPSFRNLPLLYLEGGSVCGRQLWGLNKPAGSFFPLVSLPHSGFPSSLLSTPSQGRAPGLWDGRQEPRSGRSTHGRLAMSYLIFLLKSSGVDCVTLGNADGGKSATAFITHALGPWEDSEAPGWLHR